MLSLHDMFGALFPRPWPGPAANLCGLPDGRRHAMSWTESCGLGGRNTSYEAAQVRSSTDELEKILGVATMLSLFADRHRSRDLRLKL